MWNRTSDGHVLKMEIKQQTLTFFVNVSVRSPLWHNIRQSFCEGPDTECRSTGKRQPQSYTTQQTCQSMQV